MDLPDVVGLIGVICYQIAYAGLQLGRFQQTDVRYIGLNILGPGCLLFSLFFYFNLASFITQVLWISLTTIGLVKIVRSRHHAVRAKTVPDESHTPPLPGVPTRAANPSPEPRKHVRPKRSRRARARHRQSSRP
ncbi:CBU_0592 family membrane protein [Denitromonas sp.]|uniref:CBU_0592 family membrane protein n=1 Tax=Denitromonas sp. TaxID=2734609 RepID=UPI003A85BF73